MDASVNEPALVTWSGVWWELEGQQMLYTDANVDERQVGDPSPFTGLRPLVEPSPLLDLG